MEKLDVLRVMANQNIFCCWPNRVFFCKSLCPQETHEKAKYPYESYQVNTYFH